MICHQVYASYKYPRAEVQRLRPGRTVTQATEFTPRMLTSAATGETRRVGPFHMKPDTALRCQPRHFLHANRVDKRCWLLYLKWHYPFTKEEFPGGS